MKKNHRQSRAVIFILLIIFILTISIATNSRAVEKSNRKIKNVIILIGDGTGLQQRRIAAIIKGNGNADHRLYMEKMKTSGIAYNHSANSLVTDSAASGTALSTGHRTKQGYVAVDTKRKPVKTILEVCKEKGMSTGLITTVTMAHATPACFGAHVRNRNMYFKIAEQYLDNKIDVLMGGGWKHFLPIFKLKPPRKGIWMWRGLRTDKNLVENFKNKGYRFVYDTETLKNVDPKKTDRLLGLFAYGALPYEVDRDPKRFPSVEQMTGKAIKILSKNPKGFFLMVEGGKIDWACHAHDVAGAVYDTIAFDRAVKKALDFAKKDGKTLVIVVNDHETGGMTISAMTRTRLIQKLKASAENMAMKIKKDGSNVDEVFSKYAGITDLKPDERKKVIDEANGRFNIKDVWGYGTTVIAHIISKRTGVLFSTGGHSGAPVVVAASGPGCSTFDGFYDITQIPKKIAALLGYRL